MASATNTAEFATEVLNGLGAPTTDSNVQFIERWIAREGGGGANNPLNTTQEMSGSTNLAGNSAGVKNYGDIATGVQATVKTLLNGYYPSIVSALKAGNASEADASGALSKDLSTWSGGGYSTVANVKTPSGLSPEQYNDMSPEGEKYRENYQSNGGVSGTATPKLDEQSLASEYGFAAAFFNTDPELQQLIQRAVSEQWTPQEFQAKFQATNWFQTHSDTYRKTVALQTSDPTTWNQQLQQRITDVKAKAVQMGATLDDATAKQIATNSIEFGWDDAQLGQALGAHVTLSSGGNSADVQTQMRQFIQDMGVGYSDQSLQQQLQQIEQGTSTVQDFQNQIRKLAASAFPSYANQINAGQTVKAIADPYIQDMANVLELNPNTITLNDPTIRKALTNTDNNGQPVQTGLWDFEKNLRSDPRWQYTQNATNAAYSQVYQIGKAWGFLS